MKTHLQKLVTIAIFAIIYLNTQSLQAQCGAGFTKAKVNFDMHYFTTTPPSSPLNFALGKNSVRLGWSGATNFFRGSFGSHTGFANSYGTGNDLKFDVVTGADTLVFNDEVSNLQFSLYDVDNRHRIDITAQNALGTPLNITMTKATATTNITITGSGGIAPRANVTTTTNIANTSADGTVNVTVAGPVKTVIIAISKSSGSTSDSIYLSDITACNNNSTSGVFATNYQSVSTPELGQPSYVLGSYGDSIVAVDMTNNTVELIYEVGNTNLIDTLFAPAINSLAYDPHNQIVYFSDNARTPRNKSIYKYNVLTGVKSTWVADVTTIGMQLFANGMGSGGGSFYDGALYLGQDMLTSGEPAAVWRISVDSITGNALPAVRVWSKLGNNGSSLYDWADFVINNGVFYNFNSSSTRLANTGIEHIDLNLDSTTVGYSLTSTIINGSQAGINYLGQIFHIRTNTYSLYNTTTGTIGATTSYTGTGAIPLTDAAESFKYPYDFGDAPVNYGLAFHRFRVTPNLMIGSTIDYEQLNSSDSLANADNAKNTGSANDEDGVTTFPILAATYSSYTVNVRTTNSSGAAATLYGFIDFNRDGDFDDPGERSLASNVPNGTTVATPIAVTFVGLTGGSIGSSFIRFRIASNAAEAANRSGYAATGEVEDYPIPIFATSLPVELVNFKAEAQENKTSLLTWSTASELNNDYFEIQRKKGNEWFALGQVSGKGFSNNLNSYSFIDETPENGINYYQLKQVDFDAKTDYSPMVSVSFEKKAEVPALEVSLYPNPTTNDVWIKTNQEIDPDNLLVLEVYNIIGEKVYESKINNNLQKISLYEYNKGVYFIRIGNESYRILKQ